MQVRLDLTRLRPPVDSSCSPRWQAGGPLAWGISAADEGQRDVRNSVVLGLQPSRSCSHCTAKSVTAAASTSTLGAAPTLPSAP